jgi:hypothetical protein
MSTKFRELEAKYDRVSQSNTATYYSNIPGLYQTTALDDLVTIDTFLDYIKNPFSPPAPKSLGRFKIALQRPFPEANLSVLSQHYIAWLDSLLTAQGLSP